MRHSYLLRKKCNTFSATFNQGMCEKLTVHRKLVIHMLEIQMDIAQNKLTVYHNKHVCFVHLLIVIPYKTVIIVFM